MELACEYALPGSVYTLMRTCRCLERRLLEHRVAMAGAAAVGAAAVDDPLVVDARHPDPEELQRVAAVVGEADTNPDYWFLASKDGSREGHYRWARLGARRWILDWLVRRSGGRCAAIMTDSREGHAELRFDGKAGDRLVVNRNSAVGGPAGRRG